MIRTLFLLLITSGSVVAQVNLNQGLMAYYPFSGNANDVSGNNNNPVFNNATLTADRFGNPNSAYSFNGTSSYMRILNSPTLNYNTQMSITVWVKAAGFYQGPCHGNSILVKEDAGGQPGNYLLFFDDNGFTNGQNCAIPVPDIQHQNFYGTNTPPPPGYSPFIQTNQWYMVTYTSDGTTAKLYVNCDLKLSFPANGWTFTNAYDVYLGKMNNASFPYWFNGTMDEVRLYNRALNQQEIDVLGGCAALPCSNWLRTQAVGQSVTVGDLDISGNQMTIEANFNCSSFPINRPDKWEDIVSKHSNTTDANYVLRMDLAAITTTTGHYLLSPLCDNLVLNKPYHVALVYDGINLKFYRNGFLMNQMPVTGNLILNNWMTTIGDYAVNNPVGTNFLGYINEVRMWNVARTQAQLQTYMSTSLPNPTTQTGLLGYYTFNDLLNKQGNVVYNGTLNGGATINNTNPNCNFVIDSCALNACNNIDSVRFNYTTTGCSSFSFAGSGYTKSSPINNWQWNFGDGGTATAQNTNHTYSTAGSFSVTLVATDANGCKDSITRNVNTSLLTMDAGPGDIICISNSSILQSSATGASSYSWTPAAYLNNPTILNPVATPPVTTTFYFTATNAAGCSQTDSVKIEVRSANGFSVNPPIDICKNLTVQLNASGGDIYSWSPTGSLNNAAIPNPVASPTNTTPYTVNILDTLCGFSTNLSTTVTILPLPNVRAAKTNDIDCSTPQSLLSATGATQYNWSPSGSLNNPNTANPIATATATTQYNVTGTDLSGCINFDSITVKVTKTNDGGYLMPTAFTPNNDGKNDCFGIKYWGTILQLQFSIYNRWGERIFYTTNPNGCWEGKINGVDQDPNVFVYMIKAKTTCQPEVFRKGTFILIR